MLDRDGRVWKHLKERLMYSKDILVQRNAQVLAPSWPTLEPAAQLMDEDMEEEYEVRRRRRRALTSGSPGYCCCVVQLVSVVHCRAVPGCLLSPLLPVTVA